MYYEIIDLQVIANEHNVEMDVDVILPHGKGVRFQRQIWLVEFTAALKVLENIIVKNSMDEQKRKNEEFIKKQRGVFRCREKVFSQSGQFRT